MISQFLICCIAIGGAAGAIIFILFVGAFWGIAEVVKKHKRRKHAQLEDCSRTDSFL